MLALTTISAAISQELEPLREAIAAMGIPVAYLPRSPQQYNDGSPEMGDITVYLPKVSGKLNDLEIGVNHPDFSYSIQQLLFYRVFVRVSLPVLYSDTPLDKSVVEEVANQTCFLLVGKRLINNSSPIEFEDYQLVEPKGDRWIAILKFYFSRMAEPIPDESTPITAEEIQVALYNSSIKLDMSDSTLVKER
ncbi:MAG: hypothetical protein F6K31_30435 [Symploca sp. SIO2G7]|nr:hypothetical protein [Symploca sp. SIO2G7]